MGDRAIVVSKPFFRLFEMAADDIDEWVDRHDRFRVERIEIVDRDEPRLHVPLVVSNPLVGILDVLRRHVVDAELAVILVGICVTGFLIREKPQRLMVPNREGGLLRDVRLDQLCSPPSVVYLGGLLIPTPYALYRSSSNRPV